MPILSDEQIIDRLRRSQRYRRPVGISLMLVGIGCAALMWYLMADLRTKWLDLFVQLQPGATPTTQRVAGMFDAAQFNTGFALGGLCISGLAGACSIATGGLMLVLPNRKDRLLLQCWANQRAAH